MNGTWLALVVIMQWITIAVLIWQMFVIRKLRKERDQPFICERCGRHISEHHVSYDQPPIGLTQGVFSLPTTGFYCPRGRE